MCLDQIGDIHGHLDNTSIVEFFYVVQCALVLVGDEVDGHSLAAETTSTADSRKRKKEGKKCQKCRCF